MKKGRHRRYEEARKFKRQSSSIEDIDLETDPFFGDADDDEDEDANDDPWADLAAKYNDEPEAEDERELG
ncbi:MAG: hypothetical protein AAGA17_12375 [Actinomycetota bacterium]